MMMMMIEDKRLSDKHFRILGIIDWTRKNWIAENDFNGRKKNKNVDCNWPIFFLGLHVCLLPFIIIAEFIYFDRYMNHWINGPLELLNRLISQNIRFLLLGKEKKKKIRFSSYLFIFDVSSCILTVVGIFFSPHYLG